MRSGAAAAFQPWLTPTNLIVFAALALAAGLAWAWLLSGSPSSGGDMGAMTMPAEPWSADYLLPAFAMWSVMMVAMMVPAAAPMILLHARVDKADSERKRLLHTLVFVLAYLLVWTAFSAAAAAAQALLIAGAALSASALSLTDRAAAAALLAAAAAYEMTPVKRLCLDKCHAPLLFLHRYGRPGAAGAFRLGLLHGAYCLGCCWALMLLLFVAGVMNLAWIAALGAVVLVEKSAPRSWQAHWWVAGLLAGASLALLLG